MIISKTRQSLDIDFVNINEINKDTRFIMI